MTRFHFSSESFAILSGESLSGFAGSLNGDMAMEGSLKADADPVNPKLQMPASLRRGSHTIFSLLPQTHKARASRWIE